MSVAREITVLAKSILFYYFSINLVVASIFYRLYKCVLFINLRKHERVTFFFSCPFELIMLLLLGKMVSFVFFFHSPAKKNYRCKTHTVKVCVGCMISITAKFSLLSTSLTLIGQTILHSGVTAVAVTNDCTRIISGGGDGLVRVWRLGSECITLLESMKEHKVCMYVCFPKYFF